jgi:hypothetical protein
MRTVLPGPLAAVAALGLWARSPEPAASQSYTVTPTYEFSVAQYNAARDVRGADYRSWGVMVGMERPASWWSPHVWFQRYSLGSLCPSDNQIPGGCDSSGWSVAVGPALQLVDRGPWWGQAFARVDVGSPGGRGLGGGAGLQVGVHVGGFVPQAFAGLTRFRQAYYSTLGVGVRFELRTGA